jgi:uncharacterized membrane protein
MIRCALLSGISINSPVLAILLAIPSQVSWSYFSFGVVFVTGLATIFLRGAWQKARGIDKLILFAPLFYAAPLAGFGTEHFTLTPIIASMVPSFIPWHQFWAYFIGTCFIAAALSLVTGIQARLSANLPAMTFFLFVVLMDIPGWVRDPRNRFVLALTLRELSFSAGALALAASLTEQGGERRYMADTLMFCGAVFLLADAMPREA